MMGLKTNTIKVSLHTLLVGILLIYQTPLIAQSDCLVRTAIEPKDEVLLVKARSYTQQSQGNSEAFENIVNYPQSGPIKVSLDQNKRSHILTTNNFGLSIPQGAVIKKLRVVIEGRSEGSGQIGEALVTLRHPEVGTSSNMANKGYSSMRVWRKGLSDDKWYYGRDLWNQDWTEAMLNSRDFEVMLQLRNITNQPIEAFISSISIEVTYEPLPTFCDASCPTFYVDQSPIQLSHKWTLPDGFYLTSASEYNYIIDLHVRPNTPNGVYQVCNTVTYPSSNVSCCRSFRYVSCDPGSVGDFVWIDANLDGLQDVTEAGVPNINVTLYTEGGSQVATTKTDNLGKYLFTNVETGRYYVKFDIGMTYQFTESNTFDDSRNSDVREVNGPGTTDVFFVDYGQNKLDIDAGLIRLEDLSGLVFEDSNVNGQYESGEVGLAGIQVNLLNDTGTTIRTTTTNSQGTYTFVGISIGNYRIQVSADSFHFATLKDMGNDATDSDINAAGLTDIFTVGQGGRTDIYAGYYKNGAFEGILWHDDNCNGLYEGGERLINAELVYIYNQSGRLDSVVTDSNGTFRFDQLRPGTYHFQIGTLRDQIPTILGDNILLNINDEFISLPVTIRSGETNDQIFLGVKPNFASICGVLFFDEGFDGRFDIEDELIGASEVQLLDSMGQVIARTITDTSGRYCFDSLIPSIYTVQFEQADSLIYSQDIVDYNELGSDVDRKGTTEEIVLVGGVNLINVDAGLAYKPIIGDYVWYDANRNGLQDVTEVGLLGIKVTLFNELDQIITSAVSDNDGYYLIENVAPGLYYLVADIPVAYIPTIENSQDPSLDSDITNTYGVGSTDLFSVTANQNNFDIDFGLQDNLGEICANSFEDFNVNGLLDTLEASSPDKLLTIYLRDRDSMIVDSFTNVNIGQEICFSSLQRDTYYIQWVLPLYCPTVLTGDNVANIDGYSHPIALGYGGREKLMAGFYQKGIIGDYVWLDSNENGLQDTMENGIEGILVSLYDNTDLLVAQTVTDSDGSYTISNIKTGVYYLVFEQKAGQAFTFGGVDPNMGSSVDSTGRTANFTVNPYQVIDSLDAGYVLRTATIAGKGWEDSNENGIRESGEPLLPNLEVWLYDEDLNPIRATRTDANGCYQFDELVAGLYLVVFPPNTDQPFTKENVGNDSTDSDIITSNDLGRTAFINLMPGMDELFVDAGYLPRGGAIEGEMWLDLMADGIQDSMDLALPFYEVSLYTLDSILVGQTMTAMDGKYRFNRVAPGQYYIAFERPDTTHFATEWQVGSDTLRNGDILPSSNNFSTDTLIITLGNTMMGIDGGFYATAVIQGMCFIDINENGLRDPIEEGFNGIALCLVNEDGQIVAKDTTSLIGTIDGYYMFLGVRPGNYLVQFTRPLFYQPSPKDVGNDDTIDSDAALIDNFTATTDTLKIQSRDNLSFLDFGLFFKQEFNSKLAGQVWKESQEADGIRAIDETLVEGVTVILTELATGMNTVANTDGSGSYTFENLVEGFYYLRTPLIADMTTTFLNVGMDGTIDNDFYRNDTAYMTRILYLGVSDTINYIDLGLSDEGGIGDYVWEDLNYNGFQDGGEPSLADIKLYLLYNNEVIDSTMTNSFGIYAFDHLPTATYQLQISVPDSMSLSPMVLQNNDINSDFDLSGFTTPIVITSGMTNVDIDAGLARNGSIGDRIWVDFNGNGIQNAGEPGISGLQVLLFDEDNNLIATDTSKGNMSVGVGGFYTFENVKPGNYYIVFIKPSEYSLVEPDRGNDEVDSDATGQVVPNSTDIFTLAPGEQITNKDCGLFLPGSLGDYVWNDSNENGIQDADEQGIEGVKVELLNNFGVVIGTTITDLNGNYQFNGLRQGLYSLKFEPLADFAFTERFAGNSDIDSDVDPNGATSLISLAHGVQFEDVDCGYVEMTRNRAQPSNQKITSFVSKEIRPTPNPAVFETSLKVENDGFYQLQMVDRSGLEVWNASVEAVGGIIRLNTSNLSAGMYYFTLINEGHAYNGKLLRVF